MDWQSLVDDLLPYLGYVTGLAGVVFGYLRWRAAKDTKASLNDTKASLNKLIELVLALHPEKAEEVASAVADTIRFPLPRLKAPPDLAERVPEAIDQLPEREKLLITLRYFEGLSEKEVGEVLGLSTYEVSQLHTSAVQRLKSLTGVGDEIEFVGPSEN